MEQEKEQLQQQIAGLRNILLFLGTAAGMAVHYAALCRGERLSLLWAALSVAIGVPAAWGIQKIYTQFGGMRWQQTTALIMAALFFVAAFLVQEPNGFADALVFLPEGLALYVAVRTHVPGWKWWKNIFFYAAGMGVGALFDNSILKMLHDKTIWAAAVILVVEYYMMTAQKTQEAEEN